MRVTDFWRIHYSMEGERAICASRHLAHTIWAVPLSARLDFSPAVTTRESAHVWPWLDSALHRPKGVWRMPRVSSSDGMAPTGASSNPCSSGAPCRTCRRSSTGGRRASCARTVPTPLVGGVAVVPDRRRPGRPRRLRHPRDRAGHPQAVPGHLQVDQGAHVPRRTSPRPDKSACTAGRAAHVPAARHQREPDRRRRPAEGPHASPRPPTWPRHSQKAGPEWPINGMSWTTYRNRPDAYLDEALEVTGKRITATEWLMDNTDWDLMATRVGRDRPDAARAVELRRARPPRLPSEQATRAIGDRRSPTSTAQLDDAIGSFVSRARPDDLDPVHLGPRVPVVHAHDQHGPPAEAVRLPGVQRRRTRSSGRCSGGRCGRSRARSTTRSACTGRSRCRSR